MDLRVINTFVKNFFVICTGIIMVTFIYCSIFVPYASFDLQWFRFVLLLSLLGDLPSIVFYIPMNKLKNQYTVKTVIHGILLLAVLMTAGYFVGVYNTVFMALMYAASILVVDVFVHFMNYSKDVKTADIINEKLKERHRKN